MTTNIEQDKSDFEAWYQKQGKFDEHSGANKKEMAELGFQAALKLERERQASGEVLAKPLIWEEDSENWTDAKCGFHIYYDKDDVEDLHYTACSGEGDAEIFATLDEAKAWCQSQINHWVKEIAFNAPQKSNIPDKLTDDVIHSLIQKHHPKCLKGVKTKFEVTDWYSFAKDLEKAMLAAASTPPIESDNKVREALEAAAIKGRIAQLEGKLVDVEIRALIPNTQAPDK